MQYVNFKHVDKFLFTAKEHARPFIEAGMIESPDNELDSLLELSSTFSMAPRSKARCRTGIEGDPVFLSAARLDREKDPFTVVEGYEKCLDVFPDSQLYFFYKSGSLESDVRSYVNQHPELSERVSFMGSASYGDMEDIYNSADILVQASLREFSGCAIIEAMSCGVIPVISDLPSFRSITGNGTVGQLFPTGDSEALASSLRQLGEIELTTERKRTREFFQRRLSYPRLAEQLERIYESLL